MEPKKTTLGLVVGNRGFFPDHLCREGRETVLNVLDEEGFEVVAVTPEDTKFGSVETWEESKTCAELFRKNRDRIDGVLVTLPNFGEERGVADALTIENRRDSFCGKMSTCNNLTQYDINFSLTDLHTVDPESESFRQDLREFGACCRVVDGLRGARLGAIGARPAAFNTVRYSEKILEASGISVETIDLYDLFGAVENLADTDADVKEKRQAVDAYIDTGNVPDASLARMARFGVAVDRWIREHELDATAVQCWTAMEEYFGIVPCTIMSMLSESLLPSACEVDITGAVGMLALRLASGSPSALLDWNNNYGSDPDKCVLFHCSNLPKSIFDEVKMDYQEIIAGSLGKENTYGTCSGCIRPGPFTFCRVSTDDLNGGVRSYLGEGEITQERPKTFGGYGVARIAGLQDLLAHICANGFEHHVAINASRVAGGVYEALASYLGWDVYYHI